MTAAPPEPSDPKDMATTETKKPKGVEVFVRLEETDKEHRFALRCTLPSRWLGRKSLRSLLDTFFDAYERARPSFITCAPRRDVVGRRVAIATRPRFIIIGRPGA